tara:strand:- start:1913 stop:2914 length:1002 start_codon:yes stop_codon:yes gene_type:complete
MNLDKIIKETFLNKYFSEVTFSKLKEISTYINKITSYKNQAILFEFDTSEKKQLDISFPINKKLPVSEIYLKKKEVDLEKFLKSNLELINVFPNSNNFLEFDYKDSEYILSGIFQKTSSNKLKKHLFNSYIYRYLNIFTDIELNKLNNFRELSHFLSNFDPCYIGLMNRSTNNHIVKIVTNPFKYNESINNFFNNYFKNSVSLLPLIEELSEEFDIKLSIDFDLKENLIKNRLCFEIFTKGIGNKIENRKLLEKLFDNFSIYFLDQDINLMNNLPIKKRNKIFENSKHEYYELIELFLSHIKLVINNNQLNFKIYIWGNREILKEIKPQYKKN